MPPDAVYVGRPTKFGNPYHPQMPGVDSLSSILPLFKEHLRQILVREPGFLDELRGKDLACWCQPHAPCHADILLKLANAGELPHVQVP